MAKSSSGIGIMRPRNAGIHDHCQLEVFHKAVIAFIEQEEGAHHVISE
jgi:hypothetical protein